MERARIKERFKAGDSIFRIAKDLEHSPRTVRKYVKKFALEAGQYDIKINTGTDFAANRRKHVNELVNLCRRIVSARDYNLRIGLCIGDEGTIRRFLLSPGEGGFTNTYDRLLQSSLLVHLKAEFPELAELKHLKELKVKYIDKLAQLAARRYFKGTCDICKSLYG